MTAAELMRARTVPLRMVIFDCDGVLVDSEEISNRLVAEEVTALGWPMVTADATRLFMGNTVEAIEAQLRARLGSVPDGWRARVMERIVHAMANEAEAIPGGIEALRAAGDMGLAWRVASNSSHPELRSKFGRLGLTDYVRGRVHSHTDVGIGKPAPDLFLHAAASEGVPPDECLVIEDSVAGATAARAAGMPCLGFDRFGDGWAALAAVGAAIFHDMRELPELFALAHPVSAWRVPA